MFFFLINDASMHGRRKKIHFRVVVVCWSSLRWVVLLVLVLFVALWEVDCFLPSYTVLVHCRANLIALVYDYKSWRVVFRLANNQAMNSV